jgi:hypothetical protein
LRSYRVIVLPSYSGDESQYEIGLRSNSAYYVFRTLDGGQTWAPSPPTNPYLVGNSGKHSSRSAKVKPPQAGRNLGEAEEPETRAGNEKPQPGGSLSGTWQDSTGLTFRIVDDGQALAVTLIRPKLLLRSFDGQLTRDEEGPDATSFSGTVQAVFGTLKPRSIRVTATLADQNRLDLQCPRWPVIKPPGKVVGTETHNFTWTRRK